MSSAAGAARPVREACRTSPRVGFSVTSELPAAEVTCLRETDRRIRNQAKEATHQRND